MSLNPTEALERLREGNQRFARDTRSVGSFTTQLRREELAAGQNPFAIVLSCSDSRVPAEIVFDQGIGDLFVVRVAGNVVAPSLVGSVEFAAATFGTRLVVVMGHSACGAVKATLDVVRGQATVPSENIQDIVDRVRPAVRSVVEASEACDVDALLERAIRANVRASVLHLSHGSRVLEQMVRSEQVVIVGAEYDLRTGVVDFFDVPPMGPA